MDVERMHEECGLFGIFYPGEDVANLTYFGLYALQHRGQESAGIGVSDGRQISMVKEMGLVSQVFDQESLDALHGHIAVGHTRYSTTGSTRLPNAQPMRFNHPTIGPFLLAHNGNLINAAELRDELRAQGVEFETTSDTEALGLLLARTPGETLDQVLAAALPRAEGAYCLLFLTRDSVVAARDPLGIRPMVLGRFGDVDAPGGTGYVITSETCALDVVGAKLVLDVEPGEIVSIDASGVRSTKIRRTQTKRAMCSLEMIYFARPDSVMSGKSLYEARGNMGRELAREAPADADIVITVPDSATPAAIGYANESGIPFVEGMIKSRYITRTFIQPSQKLRESGIRLKFNPMRHVLEGKRVVVVDDTIVRGTTSRRIIEEIRRAGATEVHMRVASPPVMWPCFMGIDIASRNELIAAHNSVEEVGRLLETDSLHYLSIAGLRRAMGQPSGEGFCFACFNGSYPVAVPQGLEADKLALEIPLATG
ncbi:MAG: amidophosphoribosyltransferase [Candidatus Dormibacteraeota bacterium]|uniref:Amidophosphoribosyltransferase n=1 Tax=Candidatus Amunia macphersoniae TaxID=3127014 RepID=A0A934NF40_9BACT|nr:amidophosphoribosyltransferase [Candidatus Dormibacteraeota bacterium]